MAKKRIKKQKHSKTHWLKNLLIPHQYNNYHPHLFHTKRLILHSIGAVSIKVLVSAFIFFYPMLAWMTPNVQKQASNQIIILTNKIRQNLNLSQLKTNYALNQSATDKARDMLAKQYFAHINSSKQGVWYWIAHRGYKFSMIGENLSMGYATPSSIVSAWQKSPTHYANLINKNFQDIGVAVVSGPYKNTNTVFAVQHFGRPKKIIKNIKHDNDSQKNNKVSILNNKTEKKQNSSTLTLANANHQTTTTKKTIKSQVKSASLKIVKTPQKNVQLVSAKIVLAKDIKPQKITVNVKDQKIELTKTKDKDTWQGDTVIVGDQLFTPLVPASLVINDNQGNLKISEVVWENFIPQTISRAQQYQFLKQYPNQDISKILFFSNLYFKILLVIVLGGLLISLIIEFKKVHHHVLIKSLSFTVLLVVLIFS